MAKLIQLDTNIIVGIINGHIEPKILDDYIIAASVISVMEVYALAGLSFIEERRIDQALTHVTIIPLDFLIAKRAGQLARTRRQHKADLLIAATALTKDIPLCTRNYKDFKNIPGLKVVKV